MIHEFTTREDALEAIKVIDAGEGLPVRYTETYADVYEGEGFYYIIADNITTKYLGEGTEK